MKTRKTQSGGHLSAFVHRLFAHLTALLIFIVSLGPIPKHVAFVMDGNRRYARGKGQKVREGHTEGFESLKRICLKLKIPAVTVYAFSIDNFKRTQDEVDALMGLAKSKLSELAGHGYVKSWILRGRANDSDLLQQYGVKIRFIGRRDMLPLDVLEAVDRMEKMTAGNKNGVLNVCSPYTARDETTTAIRNSVQEVYDGSLPLRTLTHSHIYNNLETCQSIRSITPLQKGLEKECGKIDIYVRTSDVRRLSDFQMWQAGAETQLHFVKTYWPEFGLTDMLPILLGWQQKVWLKAVGL